jgi:FkbM family methyltransferase
MTFTSIEPSKGDNFEDFISPSRDHKVFVDVGGYDGDTVEKALQYNPNLKIIVIEPIKHLCETIKKKFINNPNVTVVNKAAWNKTCDIEFNEYTGWSKGLSTLQPSMTQVRPAPLFTTHIDKYDVKADTLNNILSELNIQAVDYLKIDTEGSEEQVLEGFSKYNNGTRFHVEHHITNLANILDKLLEIGTNVEKVTVFRDCNVKEHVVGAVIGTFKKIETIVDTDPRNSRNNWILSHCEPGQKIIDIGSQDGHIFENTLFAKDVTSIDIDKYDFPGFIQMDANNIKFPDKSFDTAILGEILEHVKDPVQVLKEAKRVAKRILITVPNEYEWDKSFSPFKDLEEESKARKMTIEEMAKEGNPKAIEFSKEDNYRHLWHCRYYTEETLRADLDNAYIKDYKLEKLNYDGWSFWTVDTGIGSTESKIAKMIEEIKKRKAADLMKYGKIEEKKAENKAETDNKYVKIAYEPANPDVKIDIPKGPIITYGQEQLKLSKEQHMLSTEGLLPAKNKLRIALISTPFFGVPPQKYGGLEQVVWDLAEGLDELGHIVTIFGPEGSKTPKHGSLVVTGPALDTVNVNWFKEEENRYLKWKDIINHDRFDIIHDHTWFAFPYLHKMNDLKLKVLHTQHGRYQWTTAPPFPKSNLVSISKFMKKYTEQYFQQKGFNVQSEYVYNGIDLNRYNFDPSIKKTNRLLYIGRFSKFKGPHTAIEIAKKVNLPLDLIGGSFVDDPLYMKNIESMCDTSNIVIYKDASHEFKIRKLQEAKALLVPSRFNEPFGLTCIEGMACGTPIITTPDGAIPELVINKETGFICETISDMISAIEDIDTIKPEMCRRRAEEFSRRVMAMRYETLYRRMMNGQDW